MSHGNGLKTLTQRLTDLESQLVSTVSLMKSSTQDQINEGVNSSLPTFIQTKLLKEKLKESEIKKAKFEVVKSNYVAHVNKWIDKPLSNFTEIIDLTVHFVEANAPIISQIFGIIIKGDAKLNFAIELLELVMDISVLSLDLIKNAVNHFVLIMNQEKDKEAQTKTKSKSKFKKSLGIR